MDKNHRLPKINFLNINKKKVSNNWNGTGKEVREDLMALGGFSKFYKTKRQNMLINKPMSLFLDTHF